MSCMGTLACFQRSSTSQTSYLSPDGVDVVGAELIMLERLLA